MSTSNNLGVLGNVEAKTTCNDFLDLEDLTRNLYAQPCRSSYLPVRLGWAPPFIDNKYP